MESIKPTIWRQRYKMRHASREGDSLVCWGDFQQENRAEDRVSVVKTEREREQFPQIECLSNKGYQILCEQNNNCALTVVTEQGPSGNKNCSQTKQINHGISGSSAPHNQERQWVFFLVSTRNHRWLLGVYEQNSGCHGCPGFDVSF